MEGNPRKEEEIKELHHLGSRTVSKCLQDALADSKALQDAVSCRRYEPPVGGIDSDDELPTTE
jgi:hypothetical protein